MTTPICDFVSDYASRHPLRLHMPGHKGLNNNINLLDITEIEGADVLYLGDGIISASEQNASSLFHSARTLYSVEGSSLCIRAMLYLSQQHAVRTARRPCVIAGRNAHKTFHSALALLDLTAVYILPASDQPYLTVPVTPDILEPLLREYTPCAVYITSPDYLGFVTPPETLQALSALCHRYGALLLVDNAHGAYLRFLPSSQHPMDHGADICCDSAHKTLPVLTGGAYLHLSHSCPEDFVDMAPQALQLFASTSPSYLILQSLDRVNAYLAGRFAEDLAALQQDVGALRAALTRDGWECCGDEPIKLTLCPLSRGWTGYALSAWLQEQNIWCEFADTAYLVCMFAPGHTREDLERVYKALRDLPPCTSEKPEPAPPVPAPVVVLTPRQAMLLPSETLPLSDCVGRVLARSCVSCPPAVPIVAAGERITSAHIARLRYDQVDSLCVIKCGYVKKGAPHPYDHYM